MTEINKTFRETVDHYFFQLAEEEDIDRDALTAEQGTLAAVKTFDKSLHAKPHPIQ